MLQDFNKDWSVEYNWLVYQFHTLDRFVIKDWEAWILDIERNGYFIVAEWLNIILQDFLNYTNY